MKTAIIIGATGLVGSELTRQLLGHPDFISVAVFVRRPTGMSHEKLTEHIVDFSKPGEWQDQVRGDVLFSAMGTTLRKAGSKEAQWTIDFTYQFETARMASENGVKDYVLISSAGASPSSRIFYSRMKGELEREAGKLPFTRISIIRPGILDGDRKESRPAEAAAIRMMKLVSAVPFLRKYRPVHASVLARAMIRAASGAGSGIAVYELEEVFGLGETQPQKDR